ncbi:DUF6174 domain-containing protein [Nocardioides zeicaulis]|uniref:DUF6174 domain-containing protein n=1 Tax=Nocardioides zeicaulis TaxID=1776857 RepID=A0ABV6E3I0_9ACTN
MIPSTLRRTLAPALLAVLPAVLVAAAAPSAHAAADPRPVRPFVPAADEDPDVLAAWQDWEARDVDDYVISVRLSCFCVPSEAVRTVVRGDRTVRVTRGERVLPPGRGWSVDEVYELVSRALPESDSVDVEWSRQGVPTRVAVDPSQLVADDESYYTVSVRRLG